MATPLIAISTDFFTAFAALPRQKQSRVIDFVSKFRNDPNSPGINYEKVRQAADPNIRSVRIDDTYRGIVVRQEGTGVYLLLWVDHHDRAYEWARRKRCKINRKTGSVQVFDVSDVVAETGLEGIEEKSLFAKVSDEQLLKLGVPEEQIDETRLITSLEELHALQGALPEDAYEGLEWVANGFDVEEVLEMFSELETDDQEAVDIYDFATALGKPGSLRSFTVVEGEAELQAMMSAPLDKWRVFLHPVQRKIVNKDFNGPARVTGGAGTGKTVVAMHRARRLSRELKDGERLLFTTFTANLAADIQENLRKICTLEELRRIEVTHLDAWVGRFLKREGFAYQLIYDDAVAQLWEEAFSLSGERLAYDLNFFPEEWSKVICAYDLTSLKEYVQVSRLGRGVRLDRRKRMSVWKVFEEFRNLLLERQLRDIESAMNECSRFILKKHGGTPLFASIIVDEGQDLSPSAYRLLRSMAGAEHKNDLFIVGDAHQRIYGHRAALSRCGVNIRGRSSYLRINYRTTQEIRKWAFGLLKGFSFDDLDDGFDDGSACISLTHGMEPLIKDLGTADQEFEFVFEQIRAIVAQGGALEGICVVGRTNKTVQDYVDRFRAQDMRVYEIRRSKIDDRRHEGIRVATMHRVKGLEFEHLFVVSANKQNIPLASALRSDDPLLKEAALLAERCLLYVALTRARKSATITSFGGMSEFVQGLSTVLG